MIQQDNRDTPFSSTCTIAKPAAGEAHIYSLTVADELEQICPAEDELLHLLLPEELNRYNRYLVQKKKAEFFLTRKFLKGLFAIMLQKSCGQLELKPDSTGKPFLLVDGLPAPLSFNLSHTAGLISCIISEHKEIGIDVECLAGSHEELVERFFHPREISAYRKLSETQKAERFYTLWTLKEAYLKAISQGLYTPLDSFWFSLTDARGQKKVKIHFPERQEETAPARFQFFTSRPTGSHFLAASGNMPENTIFQEYHFLLSHNLSFIPDADSTHSAGF